MEEKVFTPNKPIRVTNLMLKWMIETGGRINFTELLDFTDANLSGIDLKGILLPNAVLIGLDLSCADLSYANLSGADLSNTDMTDCVLHNTILTGAEFTGTNLSGVQCNNEIGMKFVFIPPGTFMMGSPKD